MFSKLFDFSYQRNYLEALIFFIFWSLFSFAISSYGSMIFMQLFFSGSQGFDALFPLILIAFFLSKIIPLYVTIKLTLLKNISLNFAFIIILGQILLSIFLPPGTIYFFGFVLASYLSTLESKSQL